uniref:Uncharacterized protein n=1 Tax=Amphiprion percula TaxID=161767 RepID=A0A3P8SG61_AMPPE
WILRTHSSSLAMSVSSSHGFTSNRIEDLAMRAGSARGGGGAHLVVRAKQVDVVVVIICCGGGAGGLLHTWQTDRQGAGFTSL